MPVIFFHGLARSLKKKRKLVKGLTAAICEAYGVAPETVTVYIFDLPKDTCAHGGTLICDGGAKTVPAEKPWLAHQY